MNADFGLLVDFLRGELDESSAAEVRTRLENEDTLFKQFERLRRTYAVLRSLPNVAPVGAGSPDDVPTAEIPLTQPREEFVRDVRREFQARGWAGLIPSITARAEFVTGLGVEYLVRAIVGSLPQMGVTESLLEALHTQFAARSRTNSLPFIKAQPAWIKALREEFAARAVVASLPMLDVRPEFAAALREEFQQRALVSSIPQAEVRAGFERRLKVALVETQRDVEPEVVENEPVLPVVDASDPFRRRLFKSILFNSRRRVRETPKRVDVSEYQLGRELRRGWKSGKRSVALTMALHTLAIAITLFIFTTNPTTGQQPSIAMGETRTVSPAIPEYDGDIPPGERFDSPEMATNPGDWSSSGAALPEGTDGTERPDNSEPSVIDEEDIPQPERDTPETSVLGTQIRDNAPSYFRLRNMPRERKIDYLGSAELYDALDNILVWLQQQQSLGGDGGWGHADVDPRIIPKDPDLYEIQRIEMTSLAALAFLGDGHSSENSPLGYDFTVNTAINWILARQNKDGQIGPVRTQNVKVHAMATLVLAEEFGMTRASHLRQPLRDACRWLCEVEASDGGGFPFLAGQEANLTTSVWAYMALATARNVRVPPIDLPQHRIDAFLDWFEGQVGRKDVLTNTELVSTSASAALSLFAVEAGWNELPEALMRDINGDQPDLMADRKTDRSDMRYLFFGSMAQSLDLQRNGRKSNTWYRSFTDTLLENQNDDGSYPSTSDYNDLYGKVWGAALAALSIENAYRVSILNQ